MGNFSRIFGLAFSLVAMSFYGCSQEEDIMNVEDYGLQDELCTITVDLNAEGDSRLALNKDGNNIKSVWTKNDGFTVTKDGVSKAHTFTITNESAGTSKGVFVSNTTPTKGVGYYVFYPSSIKNNDDFLKKVSLRNQVQTGDDNMEHLNDRITMRHYVVHYSDIRFIEQEYKTRIDNGDGSYTVYTNNPEYMFKSAIWKFVATNLPVNFKPVYMELEVSNSNHVTFLETNGVASNDDNCFKASMELKNFDKDKDFTVYMAQSFFDITFPKGAVLRLTVRNAEGEAYYADKVFNEDKIAGGGKLWTFAYNSGWKRGNDYNYESTDYSMNGKKETLQKHTKGNGIKVVFMGDGFTDRQIADGTYKNVMKKGMEAFFSVQPFTYYRDLFDIEMIYAVSAQEGCKDDATETNPNNTAFKTYFGEGTTVGGASKTCTLYAQNAGLWSDNTLIVVMLNSTKYAGTCYMSRTNYPATDPRKKDYGEGPSVAYFPIGTTDAALARVLNHEANGHGFAKLDDEYYYSDYYSPGAYLNSLYKEHEEDHTYGWFRNVSITSDPDEVYWSDFINDSDYDSEGIGVYEGAHTYLKYWWRPTENSIMRDNNGGFNAPSRKLIYYRINKLAYGDDWDYDHDKFKALDVNWKQTSTMSARSAGITGEEFVPLARPVVTIVDEAGNVIRRER